MAKRGMRGGLRKRGLKFMRLAIRLAALALLLSPSLAYAQQAPYRETYTGKQGPILLATATALVPPTPSSTIADLVVESNSTYKGTIRCWADGSVPTATAGIELSAGASWHIVTNNLAAVQCIQESSGTPGAVDVQYGY